MLVRTLSIIFAITALLLSTLSCATEDKARWRELEPGFDVARFDTHNTVADPNGDLVIVRVDPNRWDLKVLTSAGTSDTNKRSLDQWCADFDLVAGVNAGMFQADMSTHVGYLKVDGSLINGFVNDYQSAVAIDPVDNADPPFRIFDLDEEPLKEIKSRYRTVIQNLRLVKRAGINRWQPSRDKWPETALGEDSRGRALLIYCTTPLSMHKFNEILLALPIGLIAAQHLEGNNAAQFLINHPAVKLGQIPGVGFSSNKELPNILGVARQKKSPGR